MRLSLRSASLRFLVLLTSAVPATAQSTHSVPAQFPTIQAAIAGAAAGDTILVSPGTYLEQLDYLGKDIAVRSIGGSAVTIIHAGGLGTVVSFVGGESQSAILSGFTITGGRGVGTDPGGVSCMGSSPTIRNCRFFRNEGGVGAPGAVGCLSLASPALFGCSFESNRGGDGDDITRNGGAGAIQCREAWVRVETSTFLANRGGDPAFAPSDVYGGAGAMQARGTGSRLTVRTCTFEGNQGGSTGTARHSAAGPGGIRIISSTLLILEDSSFVSNFGGSGVTAGSEGGPGAVATSSHAQARIQRSTFTSNIGGDGPASLNGQGGAGAVEVGGGPGGGPGVTISDCDFTSNRGGYGRSIPGGGALACESSAFPLVERCTFVQNTGGFSNRSSDTRGGAGALHCSGGSAQVVDCLIEGNQGGASRDGGGSGVLHSTGGSSEPLFLRCTIRGNLGSSGTEGGGFEAGSGVLNASASAHPRFEACLIEGNRGGNGTTQRGGCGAFQVESSGSIALVNCLVVRNIGGDSVARGGDGGLDLVGSGTSSITNCTFTENVGGVSSGAAQGIGGIRLHAGEVVNSIVWGNISAAANTDLKLLPASAQVKYSCIGHGVDGDGNFTMNPRLVNASAGDYRIDCGSPCLDAGTLNTNELPEFDFEGDLRVFGSTVDVGADEGMFFPIGHAGCVAGINSAGVGASISATGGVSLANNCISLFADGVTGIGAFIYSDTFSQVPFGDGFRCVAGQVYRLPPVRALNSTLRMRIEPQALAGSPSPNSTWHFQAWYRDTNSAGAGFNATDSVSISFAP